MKYQVGDIVDLSNNLGGYIMDCPEVAIGEIIKINNYVYLIDVKDAKMEWKKGGWYFTEQDLEGAKVFNEETRTWQEKI